MNAKDAARRKIVEDTIAHDEKLVRDLREALAKAEAERDALRRAIAEHNAAIEASCGRTNEYTAKARACDDYLKRGRDCVDCPYDWKIDAAIDAAIAHEAGER